MAASDQIQFLHAIRDKPECDTLRLAYADWLEENGQEKCAAFIRQQIKNARVLTDLLSRIRAATHVRTPILFEDILNTKPWERVGIHPNLMANRSVLLFVMGYGSWSNVSHGIGWHRGFPAVVCCTERNWHKYFAKFAVPPQLVCLRRASGVWGCYYNGKCWMNRSLVNAAVPEIKETGKLMRSQQAFPEVKHFRYGCNLETLRSFVNGTLAD